jgi:hypothetical protein
MVQTYKSADLNNFDEETLKHKDSILLCGDLNVDSRNSYLKRNYIDPKGDLLGKYFTEYAKLMGENDDQHIFEYSCLIYLLSNNGKNTVYDLNMLANKGEHPITISDYTLD